MTRIIPMTTLHSLRNPKTAESKASLEHGMLEAKGAD